MARLPEAIINEVVKLLRPSLPPTIEDVGQPDGKLSLPGRSGILLDFEVSDTGCGIAEDKLDKLFDPFFTTKKRINGPVWD